MLETHARLRHLVDDALDDLGLHCLSLCEAVTAHHTDEDDNLFPLLAARHPELTGFLESLRQDHRVIAGLIAAGDVAALAAVLETHFRGEEKRLVTLLNAIDAEDEHGDSGSPRRLAQ